MAGLSVHIGNSAVVASGTSAKTIYQYTAPANTGAEVKKISVTGDATSTTVAKGTIEVVKGATGGTATTDTPLKLHGHTGTVQGGGKRNFTVEPTGGTVVDTIQMNPYSGHAFGQEFLLNPGETIGFRATFGTSVNLFVNGTAIE